MLFYKKKVAIGFYSLMLNSFAQFISWFYMKTRKKKSDISDLAHVYNKPDND